MRQHCYTAPHLYYLAQRRAGYRVIARVDAPILRAIIVVRKDSDIQSLAQLKGRSLSTLDPVSLCSVLVRSHLSKAGIDPDKDLDLVTTPSHNASLLSGFNGYTDAASLMMPPFQFARPEIRETMRIIDMTVGTPHVPISVAPWLAPEQAETIAQALTELNSNETGRAVLKQIGLPGFVRTSPKEYDQMKGASEQINLDD